jgi:hypothetical protein
MVCRFCKRERKLIKAHIIPAAFFDPLRDGKRAPEIHSNTEGVPKKRTPTGIYDPEILCSECDGKFSVWEQHAKDVLLANFSIAQPITDKGKTLGYKIEDFDYAKLKLFVLSVVWRASTSSQDFYDRIDLGPHADRILEMLSVVNPGEAEDYAVTIAKFDDPEFTGMLDPQAEKMDGVNHIRLYLTGFVVYIKVDKRPTPPFLRDLVLSSDKPLVLPLRGLSSSKDGALMREIVRKSASADDV